MRSAPLAGPDGRERAVGVERLPRDDERPAGQPTAVHPRLRRETAQPVGRGPGPQRDGDRVVRGAEQHRVVVDVEHGADLQRRRRDGLAVDQQAACVAVVGDPQQGAGRGAGRHSGDDLDPVRVRVLVHEGRGPGRRVDPQHPQRALVAGLHDDEQLVGGPHHVRQVLVPDGVPGHVDPGPVEPDHDERDPCVGGARGRIGDDRRLPVGIGGVRDVPAAHRGVVDPRDQQRPAVRRPPVPPHPAHLLGRDEVGEPVGDGVRLGGGEGGGGAGREVVDVQRATADVGDAGPGGVGTGIDDRAGGLEGARRRTVGEVDDVRPSGEGEGGDGTRAVRGVGDDPARLLARPLPPGPLLGRQVLVAAGLQRARVGDQAFGTRQRIERPQAGDGVGPPAAAEERHARPVGGDRDAAGRAECEAAGPGLPAGERVRHGRQSACDGRAGRAPVVAWRYPERVRLVPPYEGER